MSAFTTSGGPYRAAADRYDNLAYRRAGTSGLDLPAFSIGLWQKFGTDYPYETRRDIVLHAFDLGITHFDNANRYGPPHRAAEKFFGQVLRTDLAAHRDELILSTKAGNPIGPSPYAAIRRLLAYGVPSTDPSASSFLAM
jgi:L-glyceraldehyde 3-phosphate reductase